MPATPKVPLEYSPPATPKVPLEYSLLYTATLCLLALGAVMVYSTSSAESFLAGGGDPSYYLKRYLIFAAVGTVGLHFLSRRGLRLVRTGTPLLLALAMGLTVAVMLPGVGVSVNGATRWLAAGPVQFQPSELLKVAIVLYAARLLAARASRGGPKGVVLRPLMLVVGAACLVLLAQPDMGTAIVLCLTVGALLVAAGTPLRVLATLGGTLAGLALVFALNEPYRRARLTAFLDPWADAGDTGFQTVQAMIAMGSGGIFGVGLGESVQKIFYLPEAHTDMIVAIIGEELGLVGVAAVAALYGLVAYGGLRAARLARDRHAKLVAAGLTSLILCQATLNLFAVMGLAPLTGVPLPFISYGSSNLVVLLGAVGVLLNVAATRGGGLGKRRSEREDAAGAEPAEASPAEFAAASRAIAGAKGTRAGAARSDRRRRDSGARRARAGDRRRATGARG